jgi:hypothetical protein
VENNAVSGDNVHPSFSWVSATKPFFMKFGFAVLYKKSRPESASFVKIGSIKSDAALKSIK